MARQMVSSGQEVYRVVVVLNKREVNPEYRQSTDPFEPYWLLLDETHEVQYGPYNSLGAAKGMLTRETRDVYGNPKHGVVGGRVERANTKWEKVDLGGK